MPTLEEITYDAGRHALADQEAIVAGVRQRTGTLLAAHALVASFLGGTTLSARRLGPWGWVALSALVVRLGIAAVLLAPWRLTFAVEARDLYENLFERAAVESEANTLEWLVIAGFGYQALRIENHSRVRVMSWLSGMLAAIMIAQTLSWLTVLAVD
jgi:hypothetical protein